MNDEPWGWHLLVDCSGLEPVFINSPLVIRQFIKKLIVDIEMVPIGEPHIIWCDTHEPEKIGYSFFQLIETSNISGHFCSFDNTGFVDIFSCKPYDQGIALELIKHYFKPKSIHSQFVERRAP